MELAKIPDEIKNLTTLEEIEEAILRVEDEEKHHTAKLDGLLQNKNTLEAQMKQLYGSIPLLSVAQTELVGLGKTIEFTSTLADDISSKVKLLDLAKNQVFKAIQRVDDILDLKTCTDGVKMAMECQDYEKAAANIHRYLCLDENVIKQSVNIGAESTNINASLQVLKNAREEMSKVVSEKFDLAVQEGNQADVEKFFKIFPWLKLEDLGLSKFSKYLSGEIAKSATSNLKQAVNIEKTDSKYHIIFSDILTILFEGIAKTIETQQILVETYYGPGKLFDLMKNLQTECDKQANKILNEFLKQRNFAETERQVQISMFANSKKNEEVKKLDPRKLETLLNEITVISSRAELYLRFIKRRIKADIEIVYPNQSERDESWSEFQKWIKSSDLSVFIHTVISKYIVIEEYYMKESIHRAKELNHLEEGCTTSSIVDDVFFIIRKCIARSIDSSSIDCVCVILNHTVTILDSDLKNMLKATVEEGYNAGGVLGNISSAYTVMQSSFQQGKIKSVDDNTRVSQHNYLITMNNLQVSSQHILRLKSSLDKDINRLFRHHLHGHEDKFNSCLDDLDNLSQQFVAIRDAAITELHNKAVKPEYKPQVSNFLSVSHNISEEEHEEYEADDPWAEQFIFNLQTLLSKFNELLMEEIYDQLITRVVNEVVLLLENTVIKSKFNRLGAMFFDKELRSLVTYITTVASWSVRDRFSRLNQISTVLNLDSVEEMKDWWGQSHMTWRLTPFEVKKILALRVEFKDADIKRLKL